MFHVSGSPRNLPGVSAQLTWDGGAISGFPEGVAEEFLVGVARLEGQQVGPFEGPYTYSNHLRSGISAAVLLTGFFEPESVQSWGDIPERDPLPADAIG